MGRRRRKQNNNFEKFIFLIIIFISVFFAGKYIYEIKVFNPEKILEKSILSEKKFDKEITEIISPKYNIKAYLLKDNTNPIISISFMFKNSGTANDYKNKVGLSSLATELLTKSVDNMTSTEFNEKLDQDAIRIFYRNDLNNIYGNLTTNKKHAKKAFNYLSLTLTKPQFNKNDTLIAKNNLIKAIELQNESPNFLAQKALNNKIYGKHPYSRNPIGKIEDIKSINKKDLQNFIKDHFAKSNLIVAFAGDIEASDVAINLDKIFENISKKGSTNYVNTPNPNIDGTISHIDYPIPQTISIFAQKSLSRNSKDFYPLYITNHILGGSGLNSRLMKKIREEDGLTYGIYSSLTFLDKSPLIIGQFSSENKNFEKALTETKKQWKKMKVSGPNDEEIKKAKNYLINSYNLRFSSIQNLSEILLSMQKYNLGIDFISKRNKIIKKTTNEDIRRVAKEILNDKQLTFINIGKEKK
jgi:zinc protease